MIGETSYGEYTAEAADNTAKDGEQTTATEEQMNAAQEENKLTGRYALQQVVRDLTKTNEADERSPELIFTETSMTAKAAMDRLAGTIPGTWT